MTSSRLPWPVAAVCITPGVVIIALAIPLWLRRVKPNLFYGVRFESTLADERVWYEINARGGRHFVLLGVFYLAVLARLGANPASRLAKSRKM